MECFRRHIRPVHQRHRGKVKTTVPATQILTSHQVIEFEGITHNPEFHIGGVASNPRTSLLSIVVDAGAAFNTGGQDISGTNYIMQWDPATRKLLYKHNLTTITQGQYGAFQDIEFDPDNNVYVVGTFPSSIMRVSAKGTLSSKSCSLEVLSSLCH